MVSEPTIPPAGARAERRARSAFDAEEKPGRPRGRACLQSVETGEVKLLRIRGAGSRVNIQLGILDSDRRLQPGGCRRRRRR